MRGHTRHLTCAVLVLVLAGVVWADEPVPAEYPLSRSILSLRDGQPDQRRIVFKARYRGQASFEDPSFAGATLRVVGATATDGDSGLIQLLASKWHALGAPPGSKGYRYDDATGSAGGVETVLVRQGRRGGTVKVVGGRANWRYAIGGPQGGISLTLTLGAGRWCAEFGPRFARNRTGRVRARAATAPASCPCERFDSTWQAIQGMIFEKHGCNTSLCHGSAAQGGLDLRPEAAYENLVDRYSPIGRMDQVEPGEQARSFLWRKLAKATLGLADVPGAGMPNGLPPIPENELEALRLWIRAGAPREGVVVNTEALLGSCLPPPEPIKIRPPAVPAPEEGIQLHAPPWDIAAQGEGEVCYATYYNVTDQIPASVKAPCPDFWGGPSRTCFFYNRSELTQDANSHHSIIHLYKGAYDITSVIYTCRGGSNNREECDPNAPDCPGGTCQGAPAFGPFTCKGGANAGLECNPKGLGVPAPAGAECGPGSGCTGRIQSSVACIFYGPPDYGFDLTGTGTNNAPSIGGSQQPVSQNSFPPEVFAMVPTEGTVVWNSHAFNLTDFPTTNEQYLNILFAGESDRTYPVRGLFDSDDIFVQNVPAFEKREYCRTLTLPKGSRLFEFSSHTHKRGKLFRIWGPGITDRCGSEPGRIHPSLCPPGPEGQNIFTTTDYSDPQVLRFDPPMVLDQDDPSSRTFKYCAVYDNGHTRPEEVKRRSTSPAPPLFQGIIGGPCAAAQTSCLAGPRKGQSCNGDDRACDSVAGANDGVCDACPLLGGVTTDDEMLIALGFYFVVP